eukprot:4039201-Amphidinium_carterae.1
MTGWDWWNDLPRNGDDVGHAANTNAQLREPFAAGSPERQQRYTQDAGQPWWNGRSLNFDRAVEVTGQIAETGAQVQETLAAASPKRWQERDSAVSKKSQG